MILNVVRPVVIFLHLTELATAGWLDKVVQYRKQQFYNDVQKHMPPIYLNEDEFKITLETASQEYKDSPKWDGESVVRLVSLLQRSKNTPPALRRMIDELTNTRRFAFDKEFNLKNIPSLAKDHGNIFYYDVVDDSKERDLYQDEIMTTAQPITDDTVIVVSNPVEAKLPSMRISVKLLKKILEERALAARGETTTTKRSRPTKTTPRSTPSKKTSTSTVSTTTKLLATTYSHRNTFDKFKPCPAEGYEEEAKNYTKALSSNETTIRTPS